MQCKISTDAIENMLVRFDRLHAVMPSGIEVDFPEDADLPPLDIKQAFQSTSASFTVWLELPSYYPNRANAIEPGFGGTDRRDDWRVTRLYRTAEVELR